MIAARDLLLEGDSVIKIALQLEFKRHIFFPASLNDTIAYVPQIF